MKTSDGKVTIKNEVTGKVTIKDIKLDWTQESSRDSLAVFCSEKKRGYYNMYTGEIAVPAQYRRAWVFAEGVAAVQKNGMIGFIDHKGNTVIDFQFPYHGNPLSEFVFSDGHCVVADTLGKCGVIDKKGNWLIKPEYDIEKPVVDECDSGNSEQIKKDMKLHEAIEKVLREASTALTFTEIAILINRQGLYARKDGKPVPASQISASVKNYPLLFDIDRSVSPIKISISNDNKL